MGKRYSRKIHHLLESAFSEFHTHSFKRRDPISLVHSYTDPKDREIAAFFAALLAYGNVPTILRSVQNVLSRLNPSPYSSILSRSFESKWDGFQHRFTSGCDLEIVCHWLHSALTGGKSLESYFCAEAHLFRESMKTRLSRFVTRLTSLPLPRSLQLTLKRRSRNLKYLIPNPERGSSCKRLNMFLRWVVRPSDGIDLGLWSGVKPSELLLPVDTHILQTLHRLGWTQSRVASWRVAEEATEILRLYCPSDPIRYDFSLCHLAMEGNDIRNHFGGDTRGALCAKTE